MAQAPKDTPDRKDPEVPEDPKGQGDPEDPKERLREELQVPQETGVLKGQQVIED